MEFVLFVSFILIIHISTKSKLRYEKIKGKREVRLLSFCILHTEYQKVQSI